MRRELMLKFGLIFGASRSLHDKGRIEVLIFIYPKCKACCQVLGVSSAESSFQPLGFNLSRSI